MDEQPKRSGGAIAALVIFSILFLLPGACGTLFFGAMLGEWISSGFMLRRGDLDLGPGIAGISSMSLVGSVILFGILVRYSRWKVAPTLSLIMAIIAAVVSILAGLMLVGRMADTTETVNLGLMVIAGLLFGAGPPLQFWLANRARNRGGEAP